MEEIVKGRNVKLEEFPSDFDTLSPERQVSSLPPSFQCFSASVALLPSGFAHQLILSSRYNQAIS